MDQEKKLTGYPSIDKPWLKYYSEEAINAPTPECTMYEYIYNQNQDNLDRVAMNYYGTNTTYGQMFEQISRMAGILESEGVREGDFVTVCMINAPETVCLLFALNKIGAVANMVCGANTPEELKKYITDLGSSLIFTIDIFQEKFVQIADEANIKKIVVTNLTQSMSFTNRTGARLLKGMKPLPLPKDKHCCSWKQFFKNSRVSTRTCHISDAPAVVTYTGGTTGGSKGAILSSKAVNSVAQQYILSETNLKRSSTWMQVLPLFIAYGITSSMVIALAVGMTQIIRIPMTESIADFCKKFKPNHVLYGPAYWEKFSDENEDIDLSNFIAPTSGGDALRPSVEEKINKYLQAHGSPHPILNGYGMTEVGAGVSVNFPHAYKFGSVGIPFAKNIITAFDTETGKELPYEQDGELCIQTPSMMLGYVSNTEETANIIRLHHDGQIWVHSGDLGYVDGDGFIYISGRLKRYFLYIKGGIQKKIFSLDIEKVLLKHSKVDNCVVVPKSDDKTFQVAVAYIILKKEFRSSQDIEAEFVAYSEEHLADGYRPVKYYFVDKFPLTKIGKVDYKVLEKLAEEKEYELTK